MKNYKTNNDNLIYIGTHQDEEYYLDTKEDLRGWSFMGLRPGTEDTLRQQGRETEPEDLGYNLENTPLSRYFDYEKWYSDMEEDWYERHDVQAEVEREETYYLGAGSGQDIFYFFKENNITDYQSFCNIFSEVTLTTEQIRSLCEAVNKYKDREQHNALPYSDQELAEREEEKQAVLEALNQ